MKILNITLMAISYILIMGSFFHSLNLVKKARGINLKDVKNEVPHGFLLRTVCSIVYYFCIVDWIIGFSFMTWAYIPYNFMVNIVGIALLIAVTALFWWTSIALGINYHGPMKLHPDHALVTDGPYRFIRHPTYLAFPLFHISLFLLTNNYVLLLAGLIMSLYTNHRRIQVEEKLLIERFGDDYINYTKKAGRYFPIIGRMK